MAMDVVISENPKNVSLPLSISLERRKLRYGAKERLSKVILTSRPVQPLPLSMTKANTKATQRFMTAKTVLA